MDQTISLNLFIFNKKIISVPYSSLSETTDQTKLLST